MNLPVDLWGTGEEFSEDKTGTCRGSIYGGLGNNSVRIKQEPARGSMGRGLGKNSVRIKQEPARGSMGRDWGRMNLPWIHGSGTGEE